MHAFDYARAADLDDALAALEHDRTKLLAGGTNLLDLMKAGIERPQRIVDIGRLPLDRVEQTGDGVRIGALATNSAVANHALIRQHYPLLARALLCGASPQLRNMATIGGNLLQRTRCGYFYDPAFPACNKRIAESGCGALAGHQRMHAIFGTDSACIATHPSDMAVALSALDACIEVRSRQRTRRIAADDFFRLPGAHPELDTNLEPREMIVAVELPRSAFGRHCCYLKLRDRASYAFALVSAAVALDPCDGFIRDARVVLGGVAHKPWRAPAAERELVGRRLDPASIERAAGAALDGARPLPGTAFKLTLAKRALEQALRIAGAGV